MKKEYAELYKEGKTVAEAVERLERIIALLRSEEGCPWDKVQTHESLKVCMVEEAYEVNEAIDNHDWDNLEEELGDVLLQVVFHSGLEKTAGRSDLCRVANRECEKMIRRHPHIFEETGENAKIPTFFGQNEQERVDTVLEKWENIKVKEKKETRTESMRAIPKSLPALRRAYKIQAKAADVGFDWDDVEEAFKKVDEEKEEVREICRSEDRDKILEEVGDLLFAAVNVARFLKVDPEDALNFTSQKFIERFGCIEEGARCSGRVLEEMTLEEMDKYWEAAKRAKRSKDHEGEFEG